MSKLVDKDRLEWLSDELTELYGTGVIDESTRRKVLENYSAESLEIEPEVQAQIQSSLPKKPEEVPSFSKVGRQNYFLLVFVLLGALLIGGGVVLLFAHNWDSLSKFQRIAVAFIPVLIGTAAGIYTIVKDKDARWRECAAFFTAAGFAVLTALISHIYNIGGTITEFCQLVMAVSLPLVYIFRSQLLAAAYCLGLFVFYEDKYVLFYLAGIVPFMLYYLFFVKQQEFRTTWMRYVSFLPILLLILKFNHHDYLRINLFATASMLSAVGLLYNDSGECGWKNPWLVVGWILLTWLLVISTSSWDFWRQILYRNEYRLESVVFWMFLSAVYIYVSRRRLTLLKLAVILSPLLPLLCVGMAIDGNVMILISNLYFVLVSVMALISGVTNRGLFEVSAGMLQLVLLIMVSFFDSRVSILTRTVVFIVTGAVFIATNIYLSRRFKKEKSPVMAEMMSDNAKK